MAHIQKGNFSEKISLLKPHKRHTTVFGLTGDNRLSILNGEQAFFLLTLFDQLFFAFN